MLPCSSVLERRYTAASTSRKMCIRDRLIRRHIFLDRRNGIVHFRGGLPYRESADGITGEIELRDLLHMANAEIVVPVSYTHLDVYKRQSPHCATALLSES